MPQLTITSAPYDGGVGTSLYDVVGADGAAGRLAADAGTDLAVGQTINAPSAPAHLRNIAFNNHMIDFMLPPGL